MIAIQWKQVIWTKIGIYQSGKDEKAEEQKAFDSTELHNILA